VESDWLPPRIHPLAEIYATLKSVRFRESSKAISISPPRAPT
jgi:hypothetical protein